MALQRAVEAYLTEHHNEKISWHLVLNNHASTRPKIYGGPLVRAVTDCKEFKESPAEGGVRHQCTLTLPNSFAPEDGRRLEVTGEGRSKDAASELACLRAVVSLMSECPGEFVLHPCHWDVPTYDLLANLPKADPASGGHQALPVHTPARLQGAGEEADTPGAEARLVELVRRCLNAHGGKFDPSNISHKPGSGVPEDRVRQRPSTERPGHHRPGGGTKHGPDEEPREGPRRGPGGADQAGTATAAASATDYYYFTDSTSSEATISQRPICLCPCEDAVRVPDLPEAELVPGECPGTARDPQ